MELKHSESSSKGSFFIEIELERVAEITYSKAGTDTIIIDHTEVDSIMAGKGIGKMLVEAVIELAEQKSLKILPLCPFANAFFKKNKQYYHLLK